MATGEKGQKKEILIVVDEWGRIEMVKNKDGSEIDYHSEEKKKMTGTDTRLLTPNDCCWRYVNGWRCSPAYC